MKRPVLVGLLIAAVAAVIGLLLSMRTALPEGSDRTQTAAAARNLTVSIGDETFDLADGAAEKPAAPGSAAMNSVRIVGEPVTGDADGDGKPDAAMLIQNDPGGSGTFYYAVLAINDGAKLDADRFHASNALPLGDRISPEGIEFTDGRFVYRFLERRAGEPMAASPSLEKTVPIHIDPGTHQISAGS